jgi:uncharacterized RDD family membrane protein YckC
MKILFSTHYYNISKNMYSNQLEGLELASFYRRFLALIIDLVVLALFLYIVGTTLNYLGLIKFGLSIGISNADTLIQTENLQYHASEFFKTILRLLIPVLYLGLITYFTNGYTIGKRILKIRIVATNHEHLSLWHSIERSLGYYASSLEFGFGFLQYFFDYNRRTVHDRIAETIVIKIKKEEKQKLVEKPNNNYDGKQNDTDSLNNSLIKE